MIVALRTRRQFDRIAREGTRIRRAQLWCTWCPDLGSQHTSVGFSITRAIGPAVTRNRLRRRLRAILTGLDREIPLPPVLLVFGARPGVIELTFAQLETSVSDMMAALRQQVAQASPTRTNANTPPPAERKP